MTREEIIKEAAADHRDTVCYGFDDPIADAQEASFIVGAEWEHKRLVEKACDWLESAIRPYAGYSDTADIIESFHEAMEE